jgi:hypothetical protein
MTWLGDLTQMILTLVAIAAFIAAFISALMAMYHQSQFTSANRPKTLFALFRPRDFTPEMEFHYAHLKKWQLRVIMCIAVVIIAGIVKALLEKLSAT